MTTKPFKETTALETWAPRIGMGAFILIFTIAGFFTHPNCDIDRVYLACRLHPLSIFDIIGCIMFYAGCFVLGGGLKFLGIQLWNPENSAKWNIITFAGLVLSIILIWNL